MGALILSMMRTIKEDDPDYSDIGLGFIIMASWEIFMYILLLVAINTLFG